MSNSVIKNTQTIATITARCQTNSFGFRLSITTTAATAIAPLAILLTILLPFMVAK